MIAVWFFYGTVLSLCIGCLIFAILELLKMNKKEKKNLNK